MSKSINKTTVIIVLAIFLTISVGYALFSDTITIEGTATAQGNFDIEATCLTDISDEIIKAIDGENLEENIKNASGYNNESCVVSDEKVTYSVSLEYPGASKFYAVKFTNAGSIDASFDAMQVGSQFENNIINVYDSNNNIVRTETGSDKFFVFSGQLVKKQDNTYISLAGGPPADEMEYLFDLTDENKPLYLLRTGASWYWVFEAYWPEEGYQEDGVYYEAKQTIEFPFEQYTK